MRRRQLLVVFAERQRLGRLDEAPGALGVVLEFHASKTLIQTGFPAPIMAGLGETFTGSWPLSL